MDTTQSEHHTRASSPTRDCMSGPDRARHYRWCQPSLLLQVRKGQQTVRSRQDQWDHDEISMVVLQIVDLSKRYSSHLSVLDDCGVLSVYAIQLSSQLCFHGLLPCRAWACVPSWLYASPPSAEGSFDAGDASAVHRYR